MIPRINIKHTIPLKKKGSKKKSNLKIFFLLCVNPVMGFGFLFGMLHHFNHVCSIQSSHLGFFKIIKVANYVRNCIIVQ